jgi:hypothetical protein
MSDVNFGPCPHCQSYELVLLPSSAADGYNRSGVQISTFRSIQFARLICLHCGLVREWVADRTHLELLRKKYGRPATEG